MKIDDRIPIKIMPIRKLTTYDLSIKTSQNPALWKKMSHKSTLRLGQVTYFMTIDYLHSIESLLK